MPQRTNSPWSRTGPLLAGALIALVSAGIQKVYSDHTLGSEIDALQLQLREHAVILAGPSGVTVQLTEIRRALEVCKGTAAALTDGTHVTKAGQHRTTEAP